MMLDSQLKLLSLNIEKLEKMIEDLVDSVESKDQKIKFLKEKIETNVKKIDEIIDSHNADS